MNKTADRLDMAMQHRKITGRELARQASVSECTVSGYRTGRLKPTYRTAKRIARVLGVKVEHLLNQ